MSTNVNFKKDVIAIFFGGLFGALVINEIGLGWHWIFGLLSGMVVGYLIRLGCDPKRVWAGLQKAIEFRPRPGFKPRFKETWFNTLWVSGVWALFALFIVFLLFIPTREPVSVAYSYYLWFVYYYLAISVLVIVVGAIVSLVRAFWGKKVPSGESLKMDIWMAKRLNSISIITWTPVWLVVKFVIMITKHFKPIVHGVIYGVVIFFKFVHQESYIACATYSGILALVVGLSPFGSLLLLIIAVAVGALIGAGLRQLLLWRIPSWRPTILPVERK